MVAAFVQGQARRAWGEDVQLCGEGGEVFEAEVQALGEGLRVMRFDRVFRLDVVDLRQLAPRQGHAA
ncbi:hypothetical protein D3C78_1663790 [compost metagenome]